MLTLMASRHHQELSSPPSTYKVCTVLRVELNHSMCAVEMAVPRCHLLLFTSPVHVLVPVHSQEPLKKLWGSAPWLGEGQE